MSHSLILLLCRPLCTSEFNGRSSLDLRMIVELELASLPENGSSSLGSFFDTCLST